MGRPEQKKNLSGDIPADLHEQIVNWIDDHKNVKIAQCLQAMTELWLVIPEHLQAMLLIVKVGTDGFGWAASQVGANVLSCEEAFSKQTATAADVCRRFMLIVKDYAVSTRMGIRTHEDAQVALHAFYALTEWIEPSTLQALPQTDRDALRHIIDVLRQWQHGPSDDAAAKDTVQRALARESKHPHRRGENASQVG